MTDACKTIRAAVIEAQKALAAYIEPHGPRRGRLCQQHRDLGVFLVLLGFGQWRQVSRPRIDVDSALWLSLMQLCQSSHRTSTRQSVPLSASTRGATTIRSRSNCSIRSSPPSGRMATLSRASTIY
jgi:hypothetical protein